MALGTLEVHPLDLTTAYSTLANEGRFLGNAAILSVRTADGKEVPGLPDYEVPKGREVVSPQAAYIVTDILAGNTDPAQNPVWGTMHLDQRHRPAPSRGAQDGHQQRRQGPVRLRLHRAADRRRSQAGRVRPGHGRLDGQQRRQPRGQRGRPGVLARYRRAALAGGHERGDPRLARSTTSSDRRASSAPRSTPTPASSPPATPGSRSRSCSSRAPPPMTTRTSGAST